MSIYYFMICKKHMERTDACSSRAGGIGTLGDSAETLLHFLVAHCGCPVEIISEHHDDSFNDRFADWDAENVEEMRLMQRID